MTRANYNKYKKAIRLSIIQSVLQKHPQFSRMKRKQKRSIIENSALEFKNTDSSQISNSLGYAPEELIGLGKIPASLMSLKDMSRFIENSTRTVIQLNSPTRLRSIQEPFLKKLDDIINDDILDSLLAPTGMTRGKRTWMPSRLLRLELLRSFRFSKWSTREFCNYLSSPMRKEERAFCKLSLHKLEMCDHSTLSKFRSSLTMEMRINLTVYFLHFFLKSEKLGDKLVHMIDSTDVAIPINDAPLTKLKVSDGTNIRFYSDLNADVGARRRKRDKSNKFVGYRLHTICVGDLDAGIAYPVVSIASAANHNDSLFLEPLVQIAQSMGLNMKILSADKAYINTSRHEKLREKYGLLTITPATSNAVLPINVHEKTGAIFHNSRCETPMKWKGLDTEDMLHVFKCNNEGECPNFHMCDKERLLKMNSGLLGTIPKCSPYLNDALWCRKITERPFNLMKHQDGLEPCKMKTYKTVSAQMIFSQIIGLTHVMAGLRSSKPKKQKRVQEVLPLTIAI